jgi:hypothetical protein
MEDRVKQLEAGAKALTEAERLEAEIEAHDRSLERIGTTEDGRDIMQDGTTEAPQGKVKFGKIQRIDPNTGEKLHNLSQEEIDALPKDEKEVNERIRRQMFRKDI